jgi:hypothetical protein
MELHMMGIIGYSPTFGEGEFSEVHSSKRFVYASASPCQQAVLHPFGAKTRRLGSSSCTFVYQGVATRNSATTREILAHRTGAKPCFLIDRYEKVLKDATRNVSRNVQETLTL